jgi:ribA/ribD-fused uncharacterized protein
MTIKQFRDPLLATDGSVVGFYEREFYVFSNFSSFCVKWRGHTWMTSEHAYQAARFHEISPDLEVMCRDAVSAHIAFTIAQSNKDRQRSDWFDQKTTVMYEICKQKLQQHEYIQQKLRQTQDVMIVEDSPVDSFWGWGTDRNGRNELGKIWMRLRKELQNGSL